MSLSTETCEPYQTTIFDALDGSTSSPEGFRVSRGPSPGSAKAPTTPATCGPTSSPSDYASAQRRFWSRMSLASRAILEDLTGSRATLTGRDTPGGRAVCVLRTLARPTSETGCSSALSGWGTPKNSDHRPGHESRAHDTARINLNDQSLLAIDPWSTPSAGLHNDGQSLEAFEARRLKHKARGINGNEAGTPLQVQAMTAWPTPQAHETGRSPEAHMAMRAAMEGGKRATAMALTAPWPTPMAGTPAQNGYNEAGNNDSSRKTVEVCPSPWPTTTRQDAVGARARRLDGEGQQQVAFQVHGLTPDPSSAATEKPGSYRLNWRFSEWLMGLPRDWLAGSLWDRPKKDVSRG